MKTSTLTRAAFLVIVLSGLFQPADAGSLTARIAERHRIIGTDVWYDGERTIFDFEGYEAWVVEPPSGTDPAAGRPWTWTMQWKTAFVPRTGVPRLLKKGFRHVTIDTYTNRMNAAGLGVSKRFQDYLVGELGFAPKARLIGMSWGGFFSIRYAAAYPDSVGRIYLDAPLLNFTGFVTHTPDAWKGSEPANGLWLDSPEMPINKAVPIAKASIPVLLIYGGKDTVVSPVLNSEIFIPRFKAAGGDITVICRRNYEHHPHGVEESQDTIMKFLLD